MRAAELFADPWAGQHEGRGHRGGDRHPQATLYYYFEGKDEILSYIFGVVLDPLRPLSTGSSTRPGRGPGAWSVRSKPIWGSSPSTPKPVRPSISTWAGRPRRPEIAARTASAYIEPIAAILRAGAADRSLRPVADPRVTAVALLGATSTAAIHALAIDPGSADPVAALASVAGAVIPLAIEGLRAGTSSGAAGREA